MDKINEIREEAKKFFLGAKGSHNFDHTERVYRLAVHIAKEEGADLEIVRIAALLHDIARPEQDRSNGKIDHASRGAELARILLEKHGFSDDFIERVAHCIEAHRFRKSIVPQTLEAKVLSDADKLDAIGAVGLGRAFLFAGEVGAKLHNNDRDISHAQEYTEEDTAYREFVVKLSKLKDRMLTAEGRRIAEGRHEFMVHFFERMNKEVDGEL
jgi:uncharacterized protein